jgi:hypothetical protein
LPSLNTVWPIKKERRQNVRGDYWRSIRLEMTVDSMQINNEQVAEAKTGDSIGVKVSERVRSGDLVYKITD